MKVRDPARKLAPTRPSVRTSDFWSSLPQRVQIAFEDATLRIFGFGIRIWHQNGLAPTTVIVSESKTYQIRYAWRGWRGGRSFAHSHPDASRSYTKFGAYMRESDTQWLISYVFSEIANGYTRIEVYVVSVNNRGFSSKFSMACRLGRTHVTNALQTVVNPSRLQFCGPWCTYLTNMARNTGSTSTFATVCNTMRRMTCHDNLQSLQLLTVGEVHGLPHVYSSQTCTCFKRRSLVSPWVRDCTRGASLSLRFDRVCILPPKKELAHDLVPGSASNYELDHYFNPAGNPMNMRLIVVTPCTIAVVFVGCSVFSACGSAHICSRPCENVTKLCVL